MSTIPLRDEEGRIAALHRYNLLGGVHNGLLDRIARLAHTTLGGAIAGISIVDRDQVFFPALIGATTGPLARDKTFCAVSIATVRPLVINDVAGDPRWIDHPVQQSWPDIRAYCGVPILTSDGFAAGAVFITDTMPRTFTDRDIATLEHLARIVMEHLELLQIGSNDALTGARTRRAFQTEVEREFSRARRYERPASLVFMDIDQFRILNDTFGHGAADEAMRAIANRCMDVMRQSDTFGRVSGEEFALLLPETLAYEASQCAERLRDLVAALRFKTEAGVRSVTASFGVAELRPDYTSAAHWFAEADVALYAAKKAGGNCVMLAGPAPRQRQPLPDERPAMPGNIGKLH